MIWSWLPCIAGCASLERDRRWTSTCRRRQSPTRCRTRSGVCVRPSRSAPQGIISLGKRYGAARLESACTRALFFDNPRYRTVKHILEKGLDQVPFGDELNRVALAATYTVAARFLRPAAELN
jgi:hypothetical protein